MLLAVEAYLGTAVASRHFHRPRAQKQGMKNTSIRTGVIAVESNG